MSVRCPHCATTVSANKARRQGNVYTYNGVTIRGTPDEQSGQVSKAEYALTAYFFVESAKYFIAECVECRNEFVVQRNPERVCWPLPNPAIPTEIPEAVRLAFQDAKVAHEAGAEIAAVMAARTAIIRMQRDQKCSSLKELVERGTLSRFLAYQADEVRLWGISLEMRMRGRIRPRGKTPTSCSNISALCLTTSMSSRLGLLRCETSGSRNSKR